jgi:hypothetical protein
MSQSTSLLLRVWTSPGTCASSDWPAHGSGSGRGLLVPVAMGKVSILQRSLEVKDGFAISHNEPGFGIAWAENAVQRYRLR